MSELRFYLVAYDITSPRRWRRVYKALSRAGERQQFSVFLCRLPPARMARLAARLSALVDAGSDRLMVLDLGPAGTAPARLVTGVLPTERAWPVVV